MNRLSVSLAAIVIVLVGTSCHRQTGADAKSDGPISSSSPPAGATTNLPNTGAGTTNPTTYLVKGVVKEIIPDKNRVRIAHEAIPGYMEAMTMVFEVKDSKELSKAKAGDAIRFRMLVTDDDGWIDSITKIDATNTVAVPETPPPDTFRRVREVEPLQVGDLLPDYQFTNQLGQPIRLQEFKGQTLALSFVYTRCPFPTFCPRISGNMAAAQQQLLSMPDVTNWHFLSISIDPEYDTPSVLANYARQYKADPKHWTFVTGPLIDVTAIAEQFGLLFWRADPTKPLNIDHNLRTVIVGPDGRVKKIIPENNWKVEELVEEVVKASKDSKG